MNHLEATADRIKTIQAGVFTQPATDAQSRCERYAKALSEAFCMATSLAANLTHCEERAARQCKTISDFTGHPNDRNVCWVAIEDDELGTIWCGMDAMGDTYGHALERVVIRGADMTHILDKSVRSTYESRAIASLPRAKEAA